MEQRLVHDWLEVGDRVFTIRYRFYDQQIGLILGQGAALVVDTRSTHRQAREILDDVRRLTGDPVSAVVAERLYSAALAVGARVHRGGTYVCMEGPAFSTLAESNTYRSWGFDIIGMTNLQEAKLAREAEICYTTIALVTDYDCWHPDHDSVTVEMIIANLVQNATTAQKIIAEAVGRMPAARGCRCGRALETAIITRPEHVPADVRTALAPIIGKYLPTS